MQCSRLTPHASRLTPHASRQKYSRSLAFTLSELLIALGIIGLIATFTIPKVLHSIDEARDEAILKAEISAIHSVLYAAWLDGSFTNQTDVLRSGLNVAYFCEPDNVAGPCNNARWSVSSPVTNVARIITHQGAVIWPIWWESGRYEILIKPSQVIVTDTNFDDEWAFRTHCMQLYFNASNEVVPGNENFLDARPGTLIP